jgi:hypothetical protein
MMQLFHQHQLPYPFLLMICFQTFRCPQLLCRQVADKIDRPVTAAAKPPDLPVIFVNISPSVPGIRAHIFHLLSFVIVL